MIPLLDHDVEIRHAHLFCGLGGGARGFNRGHARVGQLVARMRCIGGIDVDAAACRDFERLAGVPATCLDLFVFEQYRAFRGCEPPDGWREATPDDVRRAFGGERPHILFTSPPCLPASGLVLTRDGERRIDSIQAGDEVLTHIGRYRPVRFVGHYPYSGEMVGIRLNGAAGFQEFTAEHPILRRRVVRNSGTGLRRELGEPAFVPAWRLRVGDRVGFPVDVEQSDTAREFVESAGDPTLITKGGVSVGRYAKPRHVATSARTVDLRRFSQSEALWFLLGVYLGDGYRRHDTGSVAFAVGPRDGELAGLVRQAAVDIGLHCSEERGDNARNVKLWFHARSLYLIAGLFGDGCQSKRIPALLMGLEKNLAFALIRGYRASDGSEQGPRLVGREMMQARWRIVSVSIGLLRDLQRLLLRFGIYGGINVAWPGGRTQVIEGQTVNTNPRWELSVRLGGQKRTVHEFSADGSMVWVRIRAITKSPAMEEVWNLQVEEDETFCTPMIATHNCKGFSGLLSQAASTGERYQALNRLTVRGLTLALQAYDDDPPEFVLLENVPRIATRGRVLLDQIVSLLELFGYAVAETTHDCGELGGLAQSRRRFLLVARHRDKVPPFLYQPPRRRLLGVGEVLGRLPLPGASIAGPMHRMRSLQWRTWVRLAFVEAGSDWRSLEKLRVVDGMLADFGIVPGTKWHHGILGVTPWDTPSGTVTGGASPTSGVFSVADPRPGYTGEYGQHGVRKWDEPTGAVSGQSLVGGGRYAVADPRWPEDPNRHHNKLRVAGWDGQCATVIGATRPGSGALCVADPRLTCDATNRLQRRYNNVYRVVRWSDVGPAVTGGTGPSAGGIAVADPRPGMRREPGEAWASAGHYGVVPWTVASGAVTGSAGHDNGAFTVADPRPVSGVASNLPAADERLVAVIRALDGTWHRPFTTLELAALQGLVDPGEWMELDGRSDTAHRERIGNAVPSPAAEAIASVMAHAVLLAAAGQTFELSSTPIWVRPLVTAIAVYTGRLM